ncbi:MAG: LamG domain-containing protein, partial [Candidatus Bathyarchaeota archaeon]
GDITYGMFINPAAYVRIHYSGGNTLDTPNNTLKAGEWYHIVGNYDGKKVRIYVNGEVKAEKDANVAIPANTSSYVIGGTQESRDWFAGIIDECKLYNRGLTEAEIKKSMKGPMSPVKYQESLASAWGYIKVQD